MESSAHLPHLLQRAPLTGTIRQQHEVAIQNWIDPQGRSGVTHMTKSSGRHPNTTGRGREHRVPPERSRAVRHPAPRCRQARETGGEESDRAVIATSGSKHSTCEFAYTGRRSKQTGMSCNATKCSSVAVVDLADQ